MRRRPILLWLLACWFGLTLLAASTSSTPGRTGPDAILDIPVAALPAEARITLDLIARGGPFPYERDGVVFGNRERQLPPKPRGWYREYTVRTPGVRHRGARRIVVGREGECYYTDDHYASFKRIRE